MTYVRPVTLPVTVLSLMVVVFAYPQRMRKMAFASFVARPFHTATHVKIPIFAQAVTMGSR